MEERSKAPKEITMHVKSIRGMEDEVEREDFSMALENSFVREDQANGAVENVIKRTNG